METNRWIKPKGCDSGNCVEVFASEPNIGMVYIRENSFTAEEWRVFVAAVKAGEFDV